MSKRPLPRESDRSPVDVLDALNRAMTAHRAGNLAEVEACCNFILARDKRQFDALNMLAIVNAQRRNYDEAVRLIERALRVNPRSAQAYVNLGRVQYEMGAPQRAAASYAKAIAIDPEFGLAHSNFAALLRTLGRLEEALDHCDRALASHAGNVEALNNRGGVLFDLGRYGEALMSYDMALALAPGMAEAWIGRGNACMALARPAEALAAFHRAASFDPNSAEAWIAFGNGLAAAKRDTEAFAAFDRAIAIDRGSAPAWLARGSHAETTRRFDEAVAAYDTAMSIDPKLKYVEGWRLRAKLQICDWTNFDVECARLLANVKRGVAASTPLTLMEIASSPADQLKCTKTFVADRFRLAPRLPARAAGGRRDKIHVAYLSADFRGHAVASLAAGLFEHHDRARFRTTAISLGADGPDAMRSRIKAAFEEFIDVDKMSDGDAAALIRDRDVDIVVDLMGYTFGSRTGIPARRPAPIQVNYLGFPATMGADFVDYVIADRHVIPPPDQACYAEKVVYLPDAYQPNDDRRAIGEPLPQRAEAGLPAEGFVFCCLNQSVKIMPDMFDIWMRLLRRVDRSVLWLFAELPAARDNLRREAERRGVAPERIAFAERTTPARHLARHRLADLFLDTLPYNAHTTASDALIMGLPIVTCVGGTFAGRVAASLLHAIGMPELVTASHADYEALALKIATDPALLASLRAKLAANRTTHALFDIARITRHLESAYVAMHLRHRRGEPPASFAVATD